MRPPKLEEASRDQLATRTGIVRENKMVYTANFQVEGQPVGAIEGEQIIGTFLLKLLMQGDTMSLLEIHTKAGVLSPIHTHSHESLIYVVSGRLRTVVGENVFVLGPGDVCRHPRAVDHQVEALDDTTFVEIKSPPIELRQVFGVAGPVTSGI